MTHLIKHTKILLAGAALAVPASGVFAADEEQAPEGARAMPASTPEQLVASIKSCSTAVSAEGINDANLTKAGWSKGELKMGDGEEVDSVRVYSHKEVKTLIMLPPESRKDAKSCIVRAKMASPQDIASAANLLSNEIGEAPKKGQAQDVVWIAGDRAIQLVTKGDKNAPSVQVVVAYAKGAKS